MVKTGMAGRSVFAGLAALALACGGCSNVTDAELPALPNPGSGGGTGGGGTGPGGGPGTEDPDSGWYFVDGGEADGLNYDDRAGGSDPQVVVFRDALYVVWSEFDGLYHHIRVRKFDGATWSWADGETDSGLNYAPMRDARDPGVAVFRDGMYVAWCEDIGTENYRVRVRKYDGISWTWVDGGSAAGLNHGAETPAANPRLAVFTDSLYLAWEEHVNASCGQVRVKQFDGTDWSWADGGGESGLNYRTDRFGKEPQLAALAERLYLMWYEEKPGTGRWLIRVKEYDGRAWSPAENGGADGLNENADADADYPQLSAAAGYLYAAWTEFGEGPHRIRVKRFDGSTWTRLDGSGEAGTDSADALFGISPSLAVYGDALYVAWTRDDGFNDHQVRVKRYADSAWSWADGGGSYGINYDEKAFMALGSRLGIFRNSLFLAWYEDNGKNLQIRVKRKG